MAMLPPPASSPWSASAPPASGRVGMARSCPASTITVPASAEVLSPSAREQAAAIASEVAPNA
jgi:hypothetical protein